MSLDFRLHMRITLFIASSEYVCVCSYLNTAFDSRSKDNRSYVDLKTFSFRVFFFDRGGKEFESQTHKSP